MTDPHNVSEEQNPSSRSKDDRARHDIPLPPPSLVSLAGGLAHQAMISLGVFPNPIDGSTEIFLHQGRHLIDTVALLDEKTRGNQTPEESQTLANLLHELRVIFVAAQEEKVRRNATQEPHKEPGV